MPRWDHLLSIWNTSWVTLSNLCTIYLFLPNCLAWKAEVYSDRDWVLQLEFKIQGYFFPAVRPSLSTLIWKGRWQYVAHGLPSRLKEMVQGGFQTHSKYSMNVSCCRSLGCQILSKHLCYFPWMLCGSLICLLRTVAHSTSIFPTQFYAISSTALQIILNYPPVSLGLERFKFFSQIIY